MADNATVVSTSTRNFPNRLGKGNSAQSEGFMGVYRVVWEVIGLYGVIHGDELCNVAWCYIGV